MQHIDQHTLELYTLDPSAVGEQKAVIEEHLAVCAGCRDLASGMAGAYGRASALYREMEKQSSDDAARLPVYQAWSVEVRPPEHAVPAPARPAGRMERFRYYTRQHPVFAGAGSFMTLAALAVALNLLMPARVADTNPVYSHLAQDQGLIEIRNGENKRLWDLRTNANLREYGRSDEEVLSRVISIQDIDRDGANEVITVLQQGDEVYNHTMRIFDARKNLRDSKSFTEPFTYLDRSYTPNIDIGSVLVDTSATPGSAEIWVTGNSRYRSPGVTIRMDMHGTILGKYWHFGQLRDIYGLSIGPEGKKIIVLTGVNDVSDTTGGQYSVIVVLDPHKVVGEGRSTISPGFVCPRSEAELYYIALPMSDMNHAVKFATGLPVLLDTASTTLQFRLPTRPTADNATWFEFDFCFDRDMNIREVKSNNHTDAVRESLVRNGMVKGKIDRTYLQGLRDHVRYWDGEKWVKDAVRIKHPVAVAQQTN